MATASRSVVFRVTGLPFGEAEEVVTFLKASIDQCLSQQEKTAVDYDVHAIPSCDDEQTSAALVDFKTGIPTFLGHLTGNPLEDCPIETSRGDISFDRHFFGFTQLYHPNAESRVTADIIAITGLDGHAYGSWKGKGHLGRMWLRDFLSKDLPSCRTMTYGYNSKLLSQGMDTIMTYGMEFMEGLKRIRNTPELRQRPLIFIAHSFGGIVLAHCMVKAKQADSEDHPVIADLYKATYGIIFFATPHRGLLIDDIQSMIADTEDHARNILLQQINLKSDVLTSQLVDFKNLIRDRKIVSFFETEKTRRLEWDSISKSWGRTGEYITAVDVDSAILQLPSQMETPIPLHADHSKIVKFDSKNSLGYKFTLHKLREFVAEAPNIVETRFSQGKVRQPPSESKKILAWLSRLEPEKKQRDIRELRIPETGQWLLEDQEFIRWLDGISSRKILWCHGVPGAGKTVLFSLVVDQIRRQFSEKDVGIAFFYCDYRDQEQQTTINMLASLLQQLSFRLPSSTFPVIEELYNSVEFDRDNMTIDQLEETLLLTLKHFKRSYILIDALDECDLERHRKSFIRALKRLEEASIRIFITSRPHFDDIQRALGTSLQIGINASHSDIKKCLEELIDEDDAVAGIVDEPLKQEILKEVTDGAQGMFLLPILQIRTVLSHATRREMRKALKEMPKGLNSHIEETLRRVERQPAGRAKLALKVLMWICFAKRPLLVRELQHALAVEAGDTDLDEDGCPLPLHMVHFCLGLVTIDEESSTIRLVHFTVQEYFSRRQHEIFPDGELKILESCLTYLSLDEFKREDLIEFDQFEERLVKYPLLKYAANHWTKHGRENVSGDCKKLAIRFLTHGSYLSNSQQIDRAIQFRFPWISIDALQNRENYKTPLGVVAENGLSTLVEPLLDLGMDIHSGYQAGEDRPEPLMLAAKNGHVAVVKTLIEHGVDIHRIANGETALHAAASRGSEIIMLQLLENGANVNAENPSQSTPLSHAAREGHEAAVRLLVNHGADVNKSNGLALRKSIQYGHSPVFKYLISNGANPKLGAMESALMFGRDEIAEEVIKLLAFLAGKSELVSELVFAVKRFPPDRNRSSRVLMHAIKASNVEMVQFLLDTGCSPTGPLCPNCQSGFQDSPLKVAAYRGEKSIVRLLLNANPHTECMDAFTQTPLYWAARHGHEKVVRLLLEFGATEPWPGWYGTAATGAKLNNHRDIVRLLEANGLPSRLRPSHSHERHHRPRGVRRRLGSDRE